MTELAHSARPATAQARAAAGSTVPVLIVVFGIVVIWYLAAVYLNSPFQLGLYERDGKDWTAADLVRDTWLRSGRCCRRRTRWRRNSGRRPFGTPVTSKRSLVYHGWVTLSSTLLGFALGTRARHRACRLHRPRRAPLER